MTHSSISANVSTPVPQMRLYSEWLEAKHGLEFAGFEDLRRWSVEDLDAFWRSIWDYDEIESQTPFTTVLSTGTMPHVRWFEGAEVSYARHVFRHAVAADEAGQPAIVAMNERGDTVELSNLQRQILHTEARIGQTKTTSAQAALRIDFRAFLFHDFRIDELKKPLPCIDDYHADGNPHLGRCQPYAIGLIHGIRHIVHKPLQLGIDFIYGYTDFLQYRCPGLFYL